MHVPTEASHQSGELHQRREGHKQMGWRSPVGEQQGLEGDHKGGWIDEGKGLEHKKKWWEQHQGQERQMHKKMPQQWEGVV